MLIYSFPFTANFLRINIYLTSWKNEDMIWNLAVNSPGAAYDPLTLLRTRTHFGRPNWSEVYGRLQQAILAGDYIPGRKPQNRAKVGVRDFSVVMVLDSERVVLDILLRSCTSFQSYQGGHYQT
jgi:hypothetical protein